MARRLAAKRLIWHSGPTMPDEHADLAPALPDVSGAVIYPELPARMRGRGPGRLFRMMGPGLIIASVTIGSGELVIASRGGAIFSLADDPVALAGCTFCGNEPDHVYRASHELGDYLDLGGNTFSSECCDADFNHDGIVDASAKPARGPARPPASPRTGGVVLRRGGPLAPSARACSEAARSSRSW